MKNLIKNIGLILWLLIGQGLGTAIVFIYTANKDEEWFDKIYDCICADKLDIYLYFNLLQKIIMPCMIIANILIVVPLIIMALKKKDENVFKKLDKDEIGIYLSFGIMINIIISFIVESIPMNNNSEFHNALMQLATSGNFIITLFTTGILAPIMEELFFRFAILEINKNRNPKNIIIISSLIFGIAHLNIIQGCYAFIIGLILGYTYYKTKNIFTTILIHIGVNASSVIYEFISSYRLKYGILIVGIIISLYIIREIIKFYFDSINFEIYEEKCM